MGSNPITRSILTSNLFIAEVAELVDATDLKSVGLLARVGSTPAFGTKVSGTKCRPECNEGSQKAVRGCFLFDFSFYSMLH